MAAERQRAAGGREQEGEPARARVLLIGCGNQANRAIYPCVAAAGFFDVLGTCDLDEAKAAATARRTGAPRTYTDMEAALDETRPDGVFVIGPPTMQGALAARVLARGIPVFTEKPTGDTVSAARRARDAAREHGTWGMTGYMKRFNDAYRAARGCIERPEFGQPRYLDKHFYAQSPFRRPGQSDEELLWNLVMGQGCHSFDLVRFFLGDVSAVNARAVFGNNGTSGVSAQLSFASGAIGTVHLNTFVGSGNARYLLDVMGDGRAHVRVEDMRKVTYHGGPWTPYRGADQLQQAYTLEPHPLARRLWTIGHYGEVVAFGRAVAAGVAPEPPAPSLDENLACLQLCRAVWLSCLDGGKTVEPASVAGD